MKNIPTKKSFALAMIGLVLMTLGFGFAGAGALQLVTDQSVLTQQNEIQICKSDGITDSDGERQIGNLIQSGLAFLVYALGFLSLGREILGRIGGDGSMDTLKDIGEEGAVKDYILFFIVLYGGTIAFNVVFGIDLTCTLPGFPGG